MEYVNQTGNGKSFPCGRFYFQLQRLDADFEENSILNNDNDQRIIEVYCHKIFQSKSTILLSALK